MRGQNIGEKVPNDIHYLEPSDLEWLYENIVVPRIQNSIARGIGSHQDIQRACDAPKAWWFQSIFHKAAALYYAIDHTQAFLKGNKRMAYVATRVFLFGNGYRFDPEPTMMLSLALTVALDKDRSIENVRIFGDWIRTQCKKIHM